MTGDPPLWSSVPLTTPTLTPETCGSGSERYSEGPARTYEPYRRCGDSDRGSGTRGVRPRTQKTETCFGRRKDDWYADDVSRDDGRGKTHSEEPGGMSYRASDPRDLGVRGVEFTPTLSRPPRFLGPAVRGPSTGVSAAGARRPGARRGVADGPAGRVGGEHGTKKEAKSRSYRCRTRCSSSSVSPRA